MNILPVKSQISLQISESHNVICTTEAFIQSDLHFRKRGQPGLKTVEVKGANSDNTLSAEGSEPVFSFITLVPKITLQ